MRTKLLGFTLLAAVAACDSGSRVDPPATESALREVSRVERSRVDVATGDHVSDAPRYLSTQRADLQLTGDDEFVVRSKHRGADNKHHVRMQQLHAGIRVWGGDVVVHATDDAYLGMSGAVGLGIPTDAQARFDEAAALRTAKQLYGERAQAGATLAYARERVLPVYFPSADGMRLAWEVVFYTELQAGLPPGLWHTLIDAETGLVLKAFNGIHTAVHQASGPSGNAKVERSWDADLDVSDQPDGSFVMQTPLLETYDMQNATGGTGTLVTGAALTGYGDAAINDAHGFAEKTLAMMNQWYGFNSIDNQGFVVRSRVHYGSQYENAFWDGEQMTYGDGASFFYPLSGDIDVVSHEIHHGFTSFHSNLTYASESGGLNESFSDIAGTLAEFFNEGATADWDLGRDIFRDPNGALRYMCNPTQDGASIAHYSNYYEGLDVHYSSGLSNLAFCRTSKRMSSGDPEGTATVEGVRRAGQLWFLANASYWTASSSFQQGCQGTVDAARSLGYSEAEVDQLKQSWLDVGVGCDGEQPPVACDETFTTDDGTLTSPNYPTDYPNNFARTWCIAPASGAPVTLTFDAFNTEAGYDFVTVANALGEVVVNQAGAGVPPSQTSTFFAVRFTSDGVVTAPGFALSWGTGGGGGSAPTVAITAPTGGATVSGQVTITAAAEDADDDLARVEFTMPDGSVVVDDTAPYRAIWDSTTGGDGDVTLTATAIDAIGNATSADVDVVVDNGCVAQTVAATGLPRAVPDDRTEVIHELSVSGVGQAQSVQLAVAITHPYRGDLEVWLESPTGGLYPLKASDKLDSGDDVLLNVTIAGAAGAPADGVWRLHLVDHLPADAGQLTSFTLDFVPVCEATAGVLLCGVLYDTPGTDSLEEGVILCNYGATATDIAGWRIADNAGAWTVPASAAAIPAGGRVVVARNAASWQAVTGVPANFTYGLALSNTRDQVTLTNAANMQVDFVAWGTAGWPVTAVNRYLLRQSLAMDASGWAAADLGSPLPPQ